MLNNETCPHCDEDVKRDIGSNRCSLLHDVLNDISVSKMLMVSVMYFNDNSDKVVSTYLGLIQIETSDGEAFFRHLGYF